MISRSCLLAGLAVTGATAQPPPAPAPRGDTVDVYHGVEVPDPYRWMEDLEAPETRRWVNAEDARARDFVAEVAGRSELEEGIRRLAEVRRFRPPWKRGERLFYLSFQSSGGPGTFGTELHVRSGRAAEEKTLIAQDDLPAGRTLARIVPGPAGRWVAYGIARSASRWETFRILDVDRGRTLSDALVGLNGGASTVIWSPEGSGFYYERFDVPKEVDVRTARLQHERVLYHVLGTPQEEDRLIYRRESPGSGLTTGITADGRHLVVTDRASDGEGDRVLVADLSREEVELVPLVDDAVANYRFIDGHDGTLWFETDRDAPNRRVVAVELSPPGEERAPRWREVISEADEAINTWLGARMVGRYLIAGYLVDARTETRVFDLDGRRLFTLDLPHLGSIWAGFLPSGGMDETETFYSLNGLVDPGSIYSLDLESGRSTLFARSTLGYELDEFVTWQVFYRSKDGTRVPMYLVHRRGLEQDGEAPVIIYGYGFGAWAAAPWFQPHLAVWLRMGGLWALPNIRGGGEYGETWHQAGIGRNKQTAIDDYIGAVEWLIEDGYTSSSRVVLNASSAGGAVGGAALTQRPELFGAVILDYPILDMLLYDQFTGGAAWRQEFGTAENEQDFRALLAYSPVHNVRPDRCYPATMVSPGELDEVTPPLHAYKFVAALQHAQSCDAPILLRVTWGAGHTSGATVDDSIATWTDQLSFLVRVLGDRGWRPLDAL